MAITLAEAKVGMEAGAKKCAKQQVNGAVAKAQMNRAQRRAAAKQK